MKDKNGSAENRIVIKQTNILPKKDRYRTIWYSQVDYATILSLSIQKNIPMTQVAHDLITIYFNCQKGHAKTIEKLKQERILLAAELMFYINRYGKLQPSDRVERVNRDPG